MKTLGELLTPEERAAVRAPIETARTLPGRAFVDADFDRDGATDPAHLKDRQRALRAGLLARREDNRICESVQRARRSPAVDRQFYSPFRDAMHYTLSNLILDKLEEGERTADH